MPPRFKPQMNVSIVVSPRETEIWLFLSVQHATWEVQSESDVKTTAVIHKIILFKVGDIVIPM